MTVNICRAIDLFQVTHFKESVDISAGSPLGKACLNAVANDIHKFKVADQAYILEDKVIMDPEKVDQYKKISETNSSIRSKQPITYKDFLIRRNARGCLNKLHSVSDIIARIPLLTKAGLSNVEVPASYCKTCNLYYISENDFQNAKKKGIIFCRVLDEDTYQRLKGSSLINLAPKSVLSMMGYTVEKNHDPGENVRHQILALIVDNNILKKSEVISYLDFFINMRDNRPVYQDAIAKWAADRQFISDYEKGKYKTFGVKSIRRQH